MSNKVTVDAELKEKAVDYLNRAGTLLLLAEGVLGDMLLPQELLIAMVRREVGRTETWLIGQQTKEK